MACTITIDNLENGQEVYLPYGVSGSVVPIQPGGGGPAVDVAAFAWQIDDQEIHDESPAAPVANLPFEFDITSANCPTPDAWYLLTVYAWDTTGAVSTQSRTFKRLEQTIEIELDEIPPPGGP